jgi:sugar lactone lactonase YvrE
MHEPLSLDDVEALGSGLVRPECVLATVSGDLYTSDWRGGVVHLDREGQQLALYTGKTDDIPEGLRPNGIALEPDGSFLLANLGSEAGGVWRLDRKGQVRPVLVEVDGMVIPPSNFCVRDALGRLWLSVSTTLKPRALDYRKGAATGFIVLQDQRGARIVADGLGFTNECLVHPSGDALYVNETYGRRFSRFALRKNGDLGPKEVVCTFGYGQFPDGFAFDAEGNAWTTCIISNELIRIDLATGQQEVWLSDRDEAHVAYVEEAFESDRLDRPHLDTIVSRKLKNISSIAFGGPELDTAYLGCLLGEQIYVVKVPVKGHVPVHWHYPRP